MDWNDPAARLALVESVGAERYNAMIREHQAAEVVSTVNGYPIRQTNGGRWGRLFGVVDAEGVASVAFPRLDQAEAYARGLPPGNSEVVSPERLALDAEIHRIVDAAIEGLREEFDGDLQRLSDKFSNDLQKLEDRLDPLD